MPADTLIRTIVVSRCEPVFIAVLFAVQAPDVGTLEALQELIPAFVVVLALLVVIIISFRTGVAL